MYVHDRISVSNWRATMRLALLAVAVMAVASCFENPRPPCAFTCSDEVDCPAGYACGDDNRCHLQVGDALATCPDSVDAGPECTTAADCGTDTMCRSFACVEGACETTDAPAGTVLTTLPAKDCQATVCDGAGGEMMAADDSDLPDDMNDCTADDCIDGAPVHTDEMAGTVCGTDLVCDGAGACVGCVDPGQCMQPTEPDCATATCVNNTCGMDFTAADTPIASQTAGDCQEIRCSGSGDASPVGDDADLPVDNNQCTEDVCTAGSPSNPEAPLGTTCDQNGGTACDGAGACKFADGAACTAGNDCANGNCIDGVCCDSACDGTCEACTAALKGDGSDGTCGFIATNTDPGDECAGGECTGAGTCEVTGGIACTAPGQCISGNCVDGVCCDTACAGTCEACDVTGSEGTCSSVPANTDPADECAGSTTCNGAGECLIADGSSCGNGADCQSGNCVDGVCCNTACSGTCEACTAALKGGGSDGTCGFVNIGSDPQNECTNGTCNGAGVCTLDDGQTCSTGGDCFSGNCIDGYCCNVACSGTCEACDVTGSEGACTPIPLGADPDNECTDAFCDGAGVCSQCETPATCTQPSEPECGTATCSVGVCGMTFTSAGTGISSQTTGDCKVNICDGAGNSVSSNDDNDPLDDANECTLDLCTVGVPSNPPATAGTPCTQNGGTTCDGFGNCVP